MAKWKKISYAGFPLVGLFIVGNVFIHFSHEHHDDHDRTLYPYEKIRNKAYPWSCEDCNLFDGHCWDKCKEAKRALE